MKIHETEGHILTVIPSQEFDTCIKHYFHDMRIKSTTCYVCLVNISKLGLLSALH